MKFGIRKPNIKKSIKARTTGKIKRKMKKFSNPLYGKKGMGFVKKPKKAMYNKIYNKTSKSAFDVFKKSNSLFYIIFIATPIFIIMLGLKFMYYCYKYLMLGIIWVAKKIKATLTKFNVDNNKEE